MLWPSEAGLKMKKTRSYRIAKYVVNQHTNIQHKENIWTFIGAFCGIAIIGFLQSLQFPDMDNAFFIGSFGATAVLIYGATKSPFAQPRNLFFGHGLSAFAGVTIGILIPQPQLIWLSAALAVSLAIYLMQITKTVHPPGGATALIAVIGSDAIRELGYLYILFPVLSSVFIMYFIAVIVNHVSLDRDYSIELFRRIFCKSSTGKKLIDE